LKTKSLHVAVTETNKNRFEYLKSKYGRSSPELMNRMIEILSELEADGKIVL
jgi:hypothetical protein